VRVLDTDVCVEILRGNRAVLARRAAVRDEVCTTWVTAAELYYGAARSADPDGNRVLVTALLRTLRVLAGDLVAARLFGDVRADLERKGTRLADADLFIGAMAVSRRAVVVTGNRRHFERFPGVTIEDWIRG